MFNPLRPLKYLPWIALLQVALITTLIATAIELAFTLAATASPLVATLIAQLFSSPLATLLELLVSMGFGALGVVVMERVFRRHIIPTNSTLWALVPCLGLWLFLKNRLSLPHLLLPDLSYFSLLGITLGVFFKGKRFWR